jgi:AraC-like DNA-binding protein
MLNKKQYTLYVLTAVTSLKRHIDDYPLAHKSSRDLQDSLTTLNRKLLEKAFKELFGFRIKEYQVKQRIEFSKQLLKEGLPIKQVAYKCYYSSQSAYSTAFKKEFAISPSDWLKLEINSTKL